MTGSHQNSPNAKTNELLDHLSTQVRRTLKNADPDQVHDLRVASRRFAQILTILGGASGAHGVAKMRRRVKETIQLAGSVRDCDIAQKLIAKSKGSVRLQSRLRRRRVETQRELADGLKHWIDRGTAEKWRAKLNGHGALLPAEEQTLIDSAQKLFQRANHVDGSARALHKLRIAAKKLRYTMELMPFESASLEPIKKLQSMLGDINDYESARQLVAGEGAPQALLNRLEQAQEKKTKQFRRYWKREFAGKEKGWLAILSHPRSKARNG